MMRNVKGLFALLSVVTMQGCYWLEAIGGTCPQEQIVVTWPATITRGSSVTTPLLTNTLTPQNLDQAQFDVLRQLLTGTGNSVSGTYNVVWGVPAFDVNGGYIALMHDAPLSTGESRQVGTAFNGGGWGAQSVGAALPATIAVRADNFTATSASGGFIVLAGAPLRLRIDVTTRNSAGETIRVAGDAGFNYQMVNATCD